MGVLIGQQKNTFITRWAEPLHFFILPMLTFNCETYKHDNQMADDDAALLLVSNPPSIQSYQISNHNLQTQGCWTHYLYEPMQASNLAQKGKQPFACTFVCPSYLENSKH
jgi:hypothetical protein